MHISMIFITCWFCICDPPTDEKVFVILKSILGDLLQWLWNTHKRRAVKILNCPNLLRSRTTTEPIVRWRQQGAVQCGPRAQTCTNSTTISGTVVGKSFKHAESYFLFCERKEISERVVLGFKIMWDTSVPHKNSHTYYPRSSGSVKAYLI